MSLIIPFFKELGYDVYNPREFLPEFTADVGIKRGEKVDYAILHDGEPVILIEAKSINAQLDNHDSQLFRYFGTTSAKFAILTNGQEYRFFTDLDNPNKMDKKPFFIFNFANLKDSQINEIAKFRKSNFDLDDILDTASELKYSSEITNYLLKEFEDPSVEFTSLILSAVYEGRKTQAVLEKFDATIKKAFKEFINELVSDKLKAAIKTTSDDKDKTEDLNQESVEDEQPTKAAPISMEELDGYTLIKLLISDVIEDDRVFYRDNASYLNVLLDDSIRKWVCRLHFKRERKYIEFNNENRSRFEIGSVFDIKKYTSDLVKIVESLK